MFQEKKIKKSHRGLTFSFPSAGRLAIGHRYDYVIDPAANKIRIVPAENGKYKVSRKKNGDSWDSLIDLRNEHILSAVAAMESIFIKITEDAIVVSDASEKKRKAILTIPRYQLKSLRMAAGIGEREAADRILSGAQLTLDDDFNSSYECIEIGNVQRNLPDLYTIVSLFSGAGILDWPFFKDDRFKIQYAIDYDAAACETYRRNIGPHIVHGDIHRAFTKDGYALDKTVQKPDVIIGGPSCKPFSNANRHTRLADHPDSDLIVQYMRIVRMLQPKAFAMENVPEVLTACNGIYFAALKELAEECGYQVNAKIVQDNKVGGYTTRKRAVVIGSKIGTVRFPDVELMGNRHTVGDALGKVNSAWSNYSDVTVSSPEVKKRMSFVPQGGNYLDIPKEYRTGSQNRHSCTYRRLSWDAPAPTIVNWRKPPLIHPTENRTLTVAEAKALQGLPGNFQIFGTLNEKQQQVGNSVPVALGRYIKNAVLATLGRVMHGVRFQGESS